ncbi:MAG: hypothetical protein BRD55_00780 [Bacteroidetes bacterium SW_9_63_38]|nr:MAG: hypothetical protein BRD55_00780 [Bacteroidetes bacterium SW_9_63_38]
MAAVRYYLDEHIAEAVATGLRNRGIDVRTLSEAGMLGAGDEDHLAYAYEEGRVLVTYDDDFLRLAAQIEEHGGVALAPQEQSIRELVRGPTLIAEEMEREEMEGHVEFL